MTPDHKYLDKFGKTLSWRVSSLHPVAQVRSIHFNSTFQPLHVSSDTTPPISSSDMDRKLSIWKKMRRQWLWSVSDFRRNPWQYLSIPIMAAIVGYVTNWLGVSMLFYPIQWTGWSLKRWPGQPFGLFGWQGVVPTKRFLMTGRLVDVTINRLIQVKEVFAKLEAAIMAKILAPYLQGAVLEGMAPLAAVEHVLQKVAADMLANIEGIVDIRRIVVDGMTKDPRTLGQFFQRVGNKELKFLVDSGTYCGFALGLLQMLQWMVFPANWTLPVGGALVGYVTNWIALKWIFEPLNPTKFGPLILQGLFLQRQREVSAEFCSYLSQHILTSQQVWTSILQPGSQSLHLFRQLVRRQSAPWLSGAAVERLLTLLRTQLASPSHPLHTYINRRINLRALLTLRMNRLTPAQFEQVLHPVFQEDELTLIVAGGVLGLLAGVLQWWLNAHFDAQRRQKADAAAGTTAVAMVELPPPPQQPAVMAVGNTDMDEQQSESATLLPTISSLENESSAIAITAATSLNSSSSVTDATDHDGNPVTVIAS